MPGALSAAVNSAAIPDNGGPVAECDFVAWRRVLSVNLDGVFLCVRAELRAMLDSGGSIVSIGSVLGLRGHPTVPAYVTSKHAMIGLHRSVAQAYSGRGVRANVVCPGYIHTPLLDQRLDEARAAALVAQHPMGRMASEDEIAGAMFLCLERAKLVVEGGGTLTLTRRGRMVANDVISRLITE